MRRAVVLRPLAKRCLNLGVRSSSLHLTRTSYQSRPYSLPVARGVVAAEVPKRLNHDVSHHIDPTIYALSTASGKAAIAIIRVSGPACLQIYRSLCPGRHDPRPRHANVRTLYEPLSNGTAILDSHALVLYFPAPRSVTGETVLELHVHGGRAVVQAVLAAIPKCAEPSAHRIHGSIRYAEPGEFTRRAFMNNRLDLTQVEALGDTLDATTEQQRRLSVNGTTGRLAKRYEAWRQYLLLARGELEALIDFSEDQNFDESPEELCASVAEQVEALGRVLRVHAANAVKGELLRNGISVALLGAPNAGKSSLLNRVIGREAAIVSREAGTTRDVVEVGLDVGGFFVRLGDTAGLRTSGDATGNAAMDGHQTANCLEESPIGAVEQEGMRRAKARAAESDVVIVVLSFEVTQDGVRLQVDREVARTAAELCKSKDNVIVVINKSDLCGRDQSALGIAVDTAMQSFPSLDRDRIHLISCKDASARDTPSASPNTDEGGIQTFLRGLIGHFEARTSADMADASDVAADTYAGDPSFWQEGLGASERHRVLLESCLSHLDAFVQQVRITSIDGESNEADIVVAAEELRAAADCLAKITGRGESGDVEEVLGVVFEKFCVGK